jgi:FHA domain
MTHILLNPIVIIIAGLVLAAVILVTALFLFRNSGKKKGAKADKTAGASDWQRQGQPGAAGTWNQPGVGGQADNWAQQQQPGAWAAQPPAQQQPGAWGAQTPAQQQQPGAWAAQPPAQQQPGAWGAQTPPQQQPGSWAAQPQQPAANAWGPQTPPQQQAGSWNPQTPPQQEPTQWASPASPAPSASSASPGMAGSQSPWGAPDATFMPQAPAANDPWGQPQAAPPQQGGAVWGMQNSSPSQQQAPTGYGGSGSGQSWAQSGQPQQPAQPTPSNDPWGQSAQPQQPAWGQQPSGQQVPSPTAAPYNATPSWQQNPGQGPAFGGPAPAGFGAPAMQPDAASPFANIDNDKTMLRPSGPQSSLGMVRIEEGKEPGRVYEVRKDELSIGRSRESDIFLEDLAVSRLHAKIVNLGNGNYALKDEGSANGTKVNGQLVNKYQTYPLQEGDKIQLGQTVLVFARR